MEVREYYRLAEAGILNEDDRVELIDGEIVEMNPIGSPHAACVSRLALLMHQQSSKAIVWVQNPIRLDARSEPQPDLCLLKPKKDFYASAHPGAADVLLVIEVSDSSLRYDRDVKALLYSRWQIPETWIVDLTGDCIDVFTQPTITGYVTSQRFRRGGQVTSSVLAASFPVDDILPSA